MPTKNPDILIREQDEIVWNAAYNAIRDSFSEALASQKFFDAIAAGTKDAVWAMITNATDAPCEDFFNVIEKAAKTAFGDVSIHTQAEKEKDDYRAE